MKVIAVSGGVACGKSGFSRRFVERAGSGRAGVINCDEIVAELYQDPGVVEDLAGVGRSCGRDLTDSTGGLDRRKLRELLFDNSQFRVRIEEVVHPLVFQRVISRLNALSDMVRMTLIEVPLLYEVDFPLNRDLDLVVASSRRVQYRRLLDVRGLEPALAERILNAQMPLADKIRRADVVVWNDGSLAAFENQIDHLFQRCETIFN
ncbi:MAG: dephospho-CoA kinase [Verrucomicrobiales bacterium]|nr:dephospho-CoA kinase [Verrucomicrobiales bacterium]